MEVKFTTAMQIRRLLTIVIQIIITISKLEYWNLMFTQCYIFALKKLRIADNYLYF